MKTAHHSFSLRQMRPCQLFLLVQNGKSTPKNQALLGHEHDYLCLPLLAVCCLSSYCRMTFRFPSHSRLECPRYHGHINQAESGDGSVRTQGGGLVYEADISTGLRSECATDGGLAAQATTTGHRPFGPGLTMSTPVLICPPPG